MQSKICYAFDFQTTVEPNYDMGVGRCIIVSTRSYIPPCMGWYRTDYQRRQSGLKFGGSWIRVNKIFSIFPGKFPRNFDFYRQFLKKIRFSRQIFEKFRFFQANFSKI